MGSPLLPTLAVVGKSFLFSVQASLRVSYIDRNDWFSFRFQERVGEAKEQHLMHLLLSEVVVDPIDRLPSKRMMQNLVQLLCGSKIVAERFLDDDPTPLFATVIIRLSGGECYSENYG